MPDWLVVLAWVWLVLAGICLLVIVADFLSGHRQHMAIMNLVWPITALYGGPIALVAYFRIGRRASHTQMSNGNKPGGAAVHENMTAMGHDGGARKAEEMPKMRRPRWQAVAVATTHCGSGCVVGDIVAEFFLLAVPLTLWGKPIFAAWVIDYLFAFAFGIAFQYFTIKPMKKLTAGEALWTAVKIDSLSLTAWQVGMYGWMAIVTFVIFGQEISKASPVFWFMMQIAMCAGFLTSYPVTWWLVSRGIKEAM
jgi:Domain of unknown function (DUF4396)